MKELQCPLASAGAYMSILHHDAALCCCISQFHQFKNFLNKHHTCRAVTAAWKSPTCDLPAPYFMPHLSHHRVKIQGTLKQNTKSAYIDKAFFEISEARNFIIIGWILDEKTNGKVLVFEFRAKTPMLVCKCDITDFKIFFHIWAALAQLQFWNLPCLIFGFFRTRIQH